MKRPYYSKKGKKIVPLKKVGLGISIFEYKDPQLLRRFTNSRGEIKNRIANSATAKEQRRLSKAIKRARQMGLLPYQIIDQTLNLKKLERPEKPEVKTDKTEPIGNDDKINIK